MILDSKCGLRGMLVDADTGRPIRWARWADTDTGEFEAFASDPAAARRLGLPVAPLLYRGRARLRFVPMGQARAQPAAKPLSEQDKAAEAREARRGLPILMVPGRECDEPLCYELAAWSTVTEQLLDPERDAEGLWERACVLKTSKWCSRHYRLPVTISQRGVESEVEITVGRPQ